MSVTYRVYVVCGVPLKELYYQTKTRVQKTKYHEDTGESYQISMTETKYFWLDKETEPIDDLEYFVVEEVDLRLYCSGETTDEQFVGKLIAELKSGETYKVTDFHPEVKEKLMKAGYTKDPSIYVIFYVG